MSTLSKKLFISVLTLILTVGAFTATTFAWFTIGTTAQVQSFGAQVQGSSGLEISFEDTGEWVSTLTNTKLNEYLFGAGYSYVDSLGDTKNVPALLGSTFVLKPVTSPDGIDMQTIAGSSAGTALAGGYIEFDLQVRSATLGTVELTALALTGTPYNWLSDANFLLGDGTTSVTAGQTLAVRSAADAVRVSLEGTKTFVYENVASASNNVLSNESPILTKGAHNYYAVKNGGATPVLPALYTAAETATAVDDDLIVTFAPASLDNGFYYSTITVRVWIEGWDYEAYNVLFQQPIQVVFSLNKVEV